MGCCLFIIKIVHCYTDRMITYCFRKWLDEATKLSLVQCLKRTSHKDPLLVGCISRVVRHFTRDQLVGLVKSHHIDLVLILYGRSLTVTVPLHTTFRELKWMVVNCPSPEPLEFSEFHIQSRCHQKGGLDAEWNMVFPDDATVEDYSDCGDTEGVFGDGAWLYCCRHVSPRGQRALVRTRLLEMDRMIRDDQPVYYDRDHCYRPPDSAYMIW